MIWKFRNRVVFDAPPNITTILEATVEEREKWIVSFMLVYGLFLLCLFLATTNRVVYGLFPLCLFLALEVT
jgi:hypothetical protein